MSPLLLLLGAVVLASDDSVGAPARPLGVAFTATPARAPAKAPWQATTVPGQQAPGPSWVAETLTAYAGGSQPAVMAVDVPADADYTVVVRALTPDIGVAIRIKGKEYGRGLGPDGSAQVVEWVAKAVSIAGKAAASAVAGGSYSAAIAAGLSVLAKVVDAIPGAIKRARVRAWTRFRDGEKGSSKERGLVRAATKKWFSVSRSTAKSVGKAAGEWRYEGAGPGEWPMVAGESDLSAQPSVRAEAIGGDYLRLTIVSGASAYQGEVRYDAGIAGLRQ